MSYVNNLKNETYYIYNKIDDEKYYKMFETYADCYWWIIDNLDLSKKWETSIRKGVLFSKIKNDTSYFIR